MRYLFVDEVLERSADRIVTVKRVSPSEEYLRDHFPDFPVLPGVLMLEAMVQAGRLLVEHRPRGPAIGPLVLGGIRAVKYGRFVQPGDTLRLDVSLVRPLDDGAFDLKGEGTVARRNGESSDPDSAPATAVSGRFSLRPARIAG